MIAYLIGAGLAIAIKWRNWLAADPQLRWWEPLFGTWTAGLSSAAYFLGIWACGAWLVGEYGPAAPIPDHPSVHGLLGALAEWLIPMFIDRYLKPRIVKGMEP
ncbi:MAG TPA: hypothetical protein ENO24_00155 [Chloroflexi bacterium]|nr:hypothetical protein [Chloroflexota bacterium]